MDAQMNESDDKKFENKYLEVAIMLCYFLIPFVGLQWPLRHYLQVEELSAMYLLLLAFIGGNIMTCLIFIMNDKTVITKLLWTAGLLIIIVLMNLLLK
jgi:hypothetical protein